MSKPARNVVAPNDMPITVRGRVAISEDVERRVRNELAALFDPQSALIDRSTVDFEHAAQGSDDVACRIRVVMSGRPGVAVYEAGEDPESAFAQAAFRHGVGAGSACHALCRVRQSMCG